MFEVSSWLFATELVSAHWMHINCHGLLSMNRFLALRVVFLLLLLFCFSTSLICAWLWSCLGLADDLVKNLGHNMLKDQPIRWKVNYRHTLMMPLSLSLSLSVYERMCTCTCCCGCTHYHACVYVCVCVLNPVCVSLSLSLSLSLSPLYSYAHSCVVFWKLHPYLWRSGSFITETDWGCSINMCELGWGLKARRLPLSVRLTLNILLHTTLHKQ